MFNYVFKIVQKGNLNLVNIVLHFALMVILEIKIQDFVSYLWDVL